MVTSFVRLTQNREDKTVIINRVTFNLKAKRFLIYLHEFVLEMEICRIKLNIYSVVLELNRFLPSTFYANDLCCNNIQFTTFVQSFLSPMGVLTLQKPLLKINYCSFYCITMKCSLSSGRN